MEEASAYKELKPGKVAYYDGVVEVNLSEITSDDRHAFPSQQHLYDRRTECRTWTRFLHDVEKRAKVSLGGAVDFTLKDKVRDGKLYVDQGIIAGCAGGGFENICAAADILKGHSIGS